MLKQHKKNRSTTRAERVWPLDLCVVILAGAVIYLSVDRLSFSDDRWLYNTWTYVLSVPVSACLLAFLSHSLISRYAQKSIQIGFLFSLVLHLLLFVLAINVVIFRQYFPRQTAANNRSTFSTTKAINNYSYDKKAFSNDWSNPVQSEIDLKPSPFAPDQMVQIQPDSKALEKPLERPTVINDIEPPAASLAEVEEGIPSFLNRKRASSTKQSVGVSFSPKLDNKPISPEVSPSEESVSGSFQRALSTPMRRVAPVTSNLKEPNTRLRNTSPSQSPKKMTMLSNDQLNPTPVDGTPAKVRAKQESGSKLNFPELALNLLKNPITETYSAPSPREVVKNPTRETPNTSYGANLDSIRPNVLAESKRDSSVMSAGRPTLAKSSGTDFQPAMKPGRRSTRAKIAASSSPTTALADPSDTALSLKVFSDVNGAMNRVDRISRLDERMSTPIAPPLATFNPSDNSYTITDSMPNAFSLSPAEREPKILKDVQIDGDIQLPEIKQQIPPRISAKIDNRQNRNSSLPGQFLPAPPFSQRVLRMVDSPTISEESELKPTAITENAIEQGLNYLASNQNADGSWSLQGHGLDVILQSDTAATGLALLAFQGAGYTHQQHEYASTVKKGIEFLLDHQSDDGNLYRSENAISNQNVAFYSHGIAALAICEAYGMTRDTSLKIPAQSSLNYISRTQHRQRGGWRYNAQVSSDTSVTGWMMMALKSGELSGLKILPKTYEGITFWLALAQSNENADRYRYNPFAPDTPTQRHGRVETPTMTAVAALMRLYSGWTRKTAEMQSIADYLLEYPPQIGTKDAPKRDTYYWYYATQVMFHMGGDHWKAWNENLTPILIDSQITEGPLSGSWDPIQPVPDRWSAHAGRVYVTAMNLLNLEVYYRHLPIYEETATVDAASVINE